jgi:hypothetical protein
MKYTVYVDCNYHFKDESERYKLGEYETAEEALKAARYLVDEFLVRNYKPHMLSETLYENYKMFGKDPFIVPQNEESKFSAWDYAKEQCQVICDGGFVNKVFSMKQTGDDTFDEKFYELIKPMLFDAWQDALRQMEEEKQAKTKVPLISDEIQ